MYLESSRTSKMELFAKLVSGYKAPSRLDSEYTSVYKQLECNAEYALPAILLKMRLQHGCFPINLAK